MKRRALLGSLAAGSLGALAGCGDQQGPPGSATELERSETPQSTEEQSDSQGKSRWETLQDRYGFEERVDAVEDLGWDRTGERPIDDSLSESFERNALIQLPAGTYRLADSIAEEGVTNWGLVGMGEKRGGVRFTTDEGSRIEFKILDGADLLFENFTLAQGKKFDRSMGMTFFVSDNLRISNVEKAGANPSRNPEGVSGLALNVTDPEGTAVVDRFVRLGPQELLPYPKNELCVFSGRSHVGTVKYRNLQIANAGENGIYASKCPGKVHVEGGFYKNIRNDAIRIAGEGSYVKNANVLIDSDDFHPRNRGVEGNMRGIRMQSGKEGYSGGLIEDTQLDLRSSFVTQALVHIAHNQGGMRMRNSRLRNWTEYHSFRAEAPSNFVQDPWGVNLKNVRLVEHGRRGSAVEIANRPNSVFENVTIETSRSSGGRNGIVVTNSKGTTFRDVSVRTNGIPLWIRRPSTRLDQYSLAFEGDNEFTIENNLFVDSQIDLPLGDDGVVYPFREAGDDVDALLVTGLDDQRMQYEYVSL
jgi:hypothetical protein